MPRRVTTWFTIFISLTSRIHPHFPDLPYIFTSSLALLFHASLTLYILSFPITNSYLLHLTIRSLTIYDFHFRFHRFLPSLFLFLFLILFSSIFLFCSFYFLFFFPNFYFSFSFIQILAPYLFPSPPSSLLIY